MLWEFIETPTFARKREKLRVEAQYYELQMRLIQDPEKGDEIRNTGGLRKIRLPVDGRGMRGGARAIYYRSRSRNQIYMLYLFAKNEQDDLTPDQKEVLKRLVMQELE